MRKIPTLFQRDPEDMRHVLPIVTPGCEWVLDGEGIARRKLDGTCVLVRRDGLAVKAYARREVKPGRTPPPNFHLMEQDQVTGKQFGWEPGEQSGFAPYLAEALAGTHQVLIPGTYELCGPRINGNPEGYETHRLMPHVTAEVDDFLSSRPLDFPDVMSRIIGRGAAGWEGVVWHHADGRMAKLKARDFR